MFHVKQSIFGWTCRTAIQARIVADGKPDLSKGSDRDRGRVSVRAESLYFLFVVRKITVKQENANDWANFILIDVFSSPSTFNASCGTVLSLLRYSC